MNKVRGLVEKHRVLFLKISGKTLLVLLYLYIYFYQLHLFEF